MRCCAPHRPPAARAITRFDRHFVQCAHGLSLSATCHDPALYALVACLDALFGPHAVIAERPGGRMSLDQFMEGPGAALQHRPDAVIVGLDGPRSYCLVDVKTFDPAGPTHCAADHTDRTRHAAHHAVTRHCVRSEYGPLPPRMRLVVVAVSIFGAFSPAALRFFADLGRRAGDGIPTSLLDCASWSVPRFAPFIRMAVGHAVRRGLAESVVRRWARVPDAGAVYPALLPPPPAPAVVPAPAGAFVPPPAAHPPAAVGSLAQALFDLAPFVPWP